MSFLTRLRMASPLQPTRAQKKRLHGTGTEFLASYCMSGVRIRLNSILVLTLMLAALIGEDHAWKTSQCDTLEEFITSLEQFKIIKSESVGKAMRQVDRANYVRDADDAYEDSPQPIGYEATISAPHMHAWCLELFTDMMKEDMSVLDVGSGSGYLTACMAAMLKDQFPDHAGKVIGIDIIPELVLYAQKNTQAANPDLMAPKGSVAYQLANGWEGAPDHAPYDFIHVGAAAESLPQTLVDQLKVGGRMVIPMNDSPHGRSQGLYLVEKTSKDGPPTTEYLMGVRYVPLVKKL